MPPKRDPLPRVRSAPQWLGGLFVLGLIGAAVIGGGAVLWENVDVQRMTASAALREPHHAPPALAPSAPAHSEVEFDAVLYQSGTSGSYFSDADYYPGILDKWDTLLRDAGARVTRAGSATAIDSLATDDILIVPSGVCMSEREIFAMRRFAERGGGLVASWATGARDSTCTWVGWSALETITDASGFNAVGEREALYLTVPAGLPLSVGFAPATRVELHYEAQIALAMEGARVYWSDWAMNAEPVDETTGLDAAAWLGRTSAGGRIVWYGFSLADGASERDAQYVATLIRNGVWWAAGVATAEISPWPHGNRSALLLGQDVESKFTNSANLARVAREKAVPATFFVVSQLAAETPHISDSLVESGEIASHSSDHSPLAGRSYIDQRTRLSRAQSELTDWAGGAAKGFHPPEERFDENTLRAWTWVGGRYLVATNEARSGSPEVFETPDGKVVLLPRVIKNDYNVFVQDGAIRSRRLTEAYLAGMKKMYSLGALAVLSLRTQVGGDGGRVQVVADVIDSARAQGDWWFATGNEMATWWLSRWESSVSVREISPSQLQVVIRAGEDQGLDGAWLDLTLPGYPEDWIPRLGGELAPHIRSEWGVRIPLGDIDPEAEILIELAGVG